MPDYPEPPFLEWEYRLYLDLLKLPLARFIDNEATYNAAIQFKRKLTINQFRRQIPEVTPHPDERGNKYVYDLAEERENDNVIPHTALVNAWNKLVVDTNIKADRPSFDKLKLAYSDLYAAAKEAGKGILENYPTPDPEPPPAIPPEELVKAWNDIVIKNSTVATEYRAQISDLKIIYVEIYDAAKRTGLPVFEEYPEDDTQKEIK